MLEHCRLYIPPFGILQAAGFSLGLLYFYFQARNIEPEVWESIFRYLKLIIFSTVGGKLLYLACNAQGEMNLSSGYSIIFTILAFCPVAVYFFYSSNTCWLSVIDRSVVPLLLWQSVGKLACFKAGCCYGIYGEYSLWGQDRIPIQLFEAAALSVCLCLFMFMNKSSHLGRLFAIYLFVYSVIRIVAESFRGELEPQLFQNSVYVLASWLTLLFSVYFFFASKHVRIQPPKPEAG